MAAFSTERLRRKETMPLHRRIAIANRPKMEPTAMKTVPSGSVDRFMKGALPTGGGDGAGYVGTELSTVLESVGRPVSLLGVPVAASVVELLSPGRSVGAAAELVLGEFVVCWLGDEVVFPLSVVVAAGPVVTAVVLAFPVVTWVVGLLSCARPTAEKEERARNVESRSDRFNERRDGAMASVVSRCSKAGNIAGSAMRKEGSENVCP
jgi:hypothetical protein